MDWTWSEGLEQRRAKRKTSEKNDSSPASNTLPDINSGTPNARLAKSVSEPTLSPKEKERAARRAAKAAERVAAFVERQGTLSDLQERRKGFSALVREVTRASRAKDESCFIGSRGVKGFRLYLRGRFGTVLNGWRELDQDKAGQLSFNGFCRQLRNFGYHGNLRLLWSQLDQGHRGMITLADIDPRLAQTVGAFRAALEEQHGSLLTGWQQAMDLEGTGRVEEKQLAECVQKLGLDVDAAQLYSMLCREGAEALTLAEFDPESHVRFMSQPKEPPAPEGASNDQQGVGNDTTQEKPLAETAKLGSSLRCGLQSVASFKQALRLRFGSVKAAWEEAFDVHGKGRVSFGEFAHSYRLLDLIGDLKGLWKQLDKEGKGYLVFEDLDKKTNTLVAEFRAKFEAEHGNMLLAWMQCVDPKGSNAVPEKDFAEACGKVGFGGDTAALFQLLVPEPGRTVMQLRDFDNRSFLALIRGDFRMVGEAEPQATDKKSAMEKTFDERNNSCLAAKLRSANETAKREDFARTCRTAMVEQQVVDASEEFEPLCKRVYGSIISAWRRCMDVEQAGRLSFEQFCTGLRRLGYVREFRVLWKRLGLDAKGHCTLEDLDAKAHKIVTSFLELLDSFGTLDEGWKQAFQKDLAETVDEKDLAEACQRIGYQYGPAKLWQCLIPAPAALRITIWDLDPASAKRLQQGQVSHIVDPKRKPPPEADNEVAEEGQESPASPKEKNEAALTEAGKALLPNLRQALRVRHGSTVCAWRAMDPKEKGSISFGQFSLVLEDCSFHGNVKALWAALCGEKQTASFRDIDKRYCDLLDEVRQFFLGGSPNLCEAWKTHFGDDPCVPDPTPDAFVQTLKEAGFDDAKAGKVFKALLTYSGQLALTFGDLRPLLWGVDPADDREATWDGGEGGAWGGAASPSGKSPKNSTLRSTLNNSRLNNSMASELAENERVRIAGLVEEHHSQDKVVSNVKGLKTLLVNKFGSLYAGWRKALDLDENGLVTKGDFCKACFELGLKGTQQMWTELNADGNGRLSLKELDPKADEAYTALEKALIEQHGHIRNGWKQTFDAEGGFCSCAKARAKEEAKEKTKEKDKNAKDKKEPSTKPEVVCQCITPPVPRERFAAAWSKLGLPGDGASAFGLLRSDSPNIVFEDLWPTGVPSAPLGQMLIKPSSPRAAAHGAS
mmetsp:Transcript_63642/g.163821  ORF Transcript_63642/g.163821 Transcript_63642/m.163821 type:complete len:1177 (+) Transcript_63642:91-3621(+)